MSPHSFALKIKFSSWKWTTLALCFDSQFHFHLSFDLIIDFRVGYIPSLLYLPLVLVYTVKKASPWVVVRHANSMVPHDKFSIPDGPMCCHSKAAFQLQKRNIVTTKVRVRFCVENDFWWDAFLHTARIWCDGQEAAAAIFLFILIRALFSLYCSWAPLGRFSKHSLWCSHPS